MSSVIAHKCQCFVSIWKSEYCIPNWASQSALMWHWAQNRIQSISVSGMPKCWISFAFIGAAIMHITGIALTSHNSVVRISKFHEIFQPRVVALLQNMINASIEVRMHSQQIIDLDGRAGRRAVANFHSICVLDKWFNAMSRQKYSVCYCSILSTQIDSNSNGTAKSSLPRFSSNSLFLALSIDGF